MDSSSDQIIRPTPPLVTSEAPSASYSAGPDSSAGQKNNGYLTRADYNVGNNIPNVRYY